MNRLLCLLLTLSLIFGFYVVEGQGSGQLKGQKSGRIPTKNLSVDFYGQTFQFSYDQTQLTALPAELTRQSLQKELELTNTSDYRPLIDSLLAFKQRNQLNDWLYYQLIRKVAQQLCPKEQNYGNYTFCKWFMLARSGYDARIALAGHKIIFYVFNDEDISDIPFFLVDGKKYMCLNYHDYAQVNLNDDPPAAVKLEVPEAKNAFSYKVTRLPDFKPGDYIEKSLGFTYDHKQYHFNIKFNPEIKTIFANYPGVDFETYFNIPLSKQTYSSLIPLLKKNISKMDQKKGVDYLMRFTRYAFLYEDDQQNFGKEKRMSPEETLSSNYSDCDDRAALFFYLVKEIYNLPMIALLYPTHITMAVEFSRPVGDPILYHGKIYTACEPTPEQENLAIGYLSSNLKNIPYRIVYHYDPVFK